MVDSSINCSQTCAHTEEINDLIHPELVHNEVFKIFLIHVVADVVVGGADTEHRPATEGAQLPVLRKAELPLPVLRRERAREAAVRVRRARALPIQIVLAA